MSGQQHAPAALYSRERPGTHFTHFSFIRQCASQAIARVYVSHYFALNYYLPSGEVRDQFQAHLQKLRKATIIDVMTVLLVTLGSHWTNFHEILYLSIFRKSIEKVQVTLKSDEYNG